MDLFRLFLGSSKIFAEFGDFSVELDVLVLSRESELSFDLELALQFFSVADGGGSSNGGAERGLDVNIGSFGVLQLGLEIGDLFGGVVAD